MQRIARQRRCIAVDFDYRAMGLRTMDPKSRRIIPLLVLVAAFIATQHLWKIRLLIDPIEVEVAPGTVALYSTAWCNYCAQARDFLDRSGVPYTEFDIERSPSAEQAFRLLGGRGVPLVQIGDQRVHGFSPSEMRAALEQLPRQAEAE